MRNSPGDYTPRGTCVPCVQFLSLHASQAADRGSSHAHLIRPSPLHSILHIASHRYSRVLCLAFFPNPVRLLGWVRYVQGPTALDAYRSMTYLRLRVNPCTYTTLHVSLRLLLQDMCTSHAEPRKRCSLAHLASCDYQERKLVQQKQISSFNVSRNRDATYTW